MSQPATKRKKRLWAGLPGFALACLTLCTVLLPRGRAHAAGAPSALCVASCERHVHDRASRAQICGRCLLLGDRRAGWVEVASERSPFPEDLIRSALGDEDWAVFAAAARALASHAGRSEEAIGARHLLAADAAHKERACTQLYRFGAGKKLTFSRVRAQLSRKGGRDGARAARALAGCEAAARAALELEVYAIDPRVQLEAVRHLAALEGVSPAVAVVEAMGSRPPESDEIAARALLLDAKNGGDPVGLSLLRAANAKNQERVNRLVTRYAQDVRAIARGRVDPDPLARKGVVVELRAYGPLATPELETMLTDADPGVRLGAAKAIVDAEGRTFEAAVRARIHPAEDKALSPELQARWLELYGNAGSDHCKGRLMREVAQDSAAADPVRAAALRALASCSGHDAQKIVLAALSSESAQVRASAVAALIDAPRSQTVRAAAAKALADPSPEVKAAALPVVAAQRQSGLSDEIAALADHSDAKVRAAAVRALGTIASRAHVSRVAERLRTDPDRDVRIAAVEALGEIGGAVAVGALTEAAAKDAESRVRYLAHQRLRAMGFHR